MFHRLLPFRFPELQRVDPADRQSLWNAAFNRVLKQPGYWLIAVGLQLAGQMCINVPLSRFARSRGSYGLFVEYLLPFGIALLMAVYITWIVRRRITLNLREELNRRGFLTCTKCSYDLTGNLSGTCPECGSATRDLRKEDRDLGS